MKTTNFFVTILLYCYFAVTIARGTTYYGLTGGDPTNLSNWGTTSGGSGTNPGSFTNTGDKFIIENGTTMTASTVWTVGAGNTIASTLQINSGGTLVMSTYLLTLASCNYTNSGTFSSSGGVTISGTATTSIGGFTTTGTVSCITTGGTATLMGDMNAGALTLNGVGGTFALSSGAGVVLNHVVTGDVTITKGTLKQAAANLSIGGNFTNPGGSYNKGQGTVHFNGTSAQQTNITTFNSLRINNNNGGVSLLANTTLSSNLAIGDSITNSILYDGGFQISSTSTLNLASGTLDLIDTLPAFSSVTIGAGTTVIYESGSAQKVSTIRGGASIPYQNLTFNNAGIKTTDAGTLTILGNWDVESPTALNTNNTTVNLSGNISGAGSITSGSGTINIGGNWTNNGTFTSGIRNSEL